MERLTVLYDQRCGFCLKVASWLAQQPSYLELEIVAAQSSAVKLNFPELTEIAGEEMLVIDDTGGLYRGSSAYIMVLYALNEYREWSYRLTHPLLYPLAKKAIQLISENRLGISKLLGMRKVDEISSILCNVQEKSCSYIE